MLDQDAAPTCEDINECEEGAYPCDPLQTCVNLDGPDGRYYCTECPDGYLKAVTPTREYCIDIDECLDPVGHPECPAEPACLNFPGGYTCAPEVGDLGGVTDEGDSDGDGLELPSTQAKTPTHYLAKFTRTLSHIKTHTGNTRTQGPLSLTVGIVVPRAIDSLELTYGYVGQSPRQACIAVKWTAPDPSYLNESFTPAPGTAPPILVFPATLQVSPHAHVCPTA